MSLPGSGKYRISCFFHLSNQGVEWSCSIVEPRVKASWVLVRLENFRRLDGTFLPLPRLPVGESGSPTWNEANGGSTSFLGVMR